MPTEYQLAAFSSQGSGISAIDSNTNLQSKESVDKRNIKPRRKIGTYPIFSQNCLPGGKTSATYDPTTYTYSTYNLNDGLQPSILAIEGDTQVGGFGYNTSSNDINGNRGTHPDPHVVTEKAFYTELEGRNKSRTPGLHRNTTFLRVDLTENNKVFRHNGVIVKGSIHCTNQVLLSSPVWQAYWDHKDEIYGLYDFEFYFICQPLASLSGSTSYGTSNIGRLSTLSTSYFYLRNRSHGDSGPVFVGDRLTFKPPVVTPQLAPHQNWAEFALQSETGAHSDDISTVGAIQRQYYDGTTEYVTPVTAGWTDTSGDKFDLNHVNFKLGLPLDPTLRFAVKGTYLLI
jgi:hypothetical protein